MKILALESAPETVNQAPYDAGWMIKFRPADAKAADALLAAADYEKLIA